MTAAEETLIINRVLSGDGDAFEALVLEHQKNVYNLALRLTGNEQDALDASQEAFIKAYTKLGSFRGGSRFSAWLYRVTYNICLDMLRKNGRSNVISLNYTDSDGEEGEYEIPDSRPTPEDALEKRELTEAINEAMEHLSPEHRQILALREGADMSYADISALLGINEGSVKSRISRARKSLAKILTENGTFSPEERQIRERRGNSHERV